jgi:hypothetical protein
MKVTVRFLDGEVLNGDSEAATATRMGFPVMFQGGNNQIAWISMASIKYVIFHTSHFDDGAPEDPRHDQGLIKVVLHFVDGETMRTYKDDTFSQEGEGFYLRLWDAEANALKRVLVSLHALKAIFFVNQWDSRTEAEKEEHARAERGDKAGKPDDIRMEALRKVDELKPADGG